MPALIRELCAYINLTLSGLGMTTLYDLIIFHAPLTG